jgi:hypothetical protein
VLFAADDSWYLEVMGDGTRFRYHGNVDDSAKHRADAETTLDLATLERLGREFIASRLAPLIPPVTGERLVFLGSRYLREGSATETEPFTRTVRASVAVFGREVGGAFVAGSGSRITVWFSAAGEPVAFFADWPTYRVSDRTQRTLDVSSIADRIKSYADKPRDLIERNVKYFECGYVDLGVFKRGADVIQSGCVIMHSGAIDDFHYGAVETVPIGVPVVPDPQRPVTTFISGGHRWDPCPVSKATCAEPRSTPAGGGRSLGLSGSRSE